MSLNTHEDTSALTVFYLKAHGSRFVRLFLCHVPQRYFFELARLIREIYGHSWNGKVHT